MTQRTDVVVVGGGPAGAAAAVELARAAIHVVLLDKARFPRDKCCGDGLTTGALRQLEGLGLDPARVPSWQPIEGAWVRSPSGRTVEFPFTSDGVFGAVARRQDLDAAVLDLARDAGVEVREGHAFEDLRVSATGVTLTAAGLDPIAARYVVAADGAWSPVRRALGLTEPGYLGEWHAFRQYVAAPGGDARHLWVWFEPELLPGYAWSFPLPGGRANVGFGIRRRAGSTTGSMAATWRRLLDVPHIKDTLGAGACAEAPHKAWPIPARLPTASLHGGGGRVLFVGDAARASDPLTGEGIGQALETGRLAAACVAAAGPDRPAACASRYASELHAGMAVDHRLAGLLSRALESSAGARGAVRIAGASAWTRRNFARWLFEDYPRAVVATPLRWHAGMFRGSGPFAATLR